MAGVSVSSGLNRGLSEAGEWVWEAVVGPGGGSLRGLMVDARPVRMKGMEGRLLLESQLLTAFALLAFQMADMVGRGSASFFRLLIKEGTAVQVFLFLLPLGLWFNLAYAPPTRRTTSRHLILACVTLMGLTSGYYLSGSAPVPGYRPPFFLLPLLSGLVWGGLGKVMASRRWLLLLTGVAMPGLAVASLEGWVEAAELSGATWYLLVLAERGVAFLAAQTGFRRLRERRFSFLRHSLVYAVGTIWIVTGILYCLAIPVTRPCYVPKFDERSLVAQTKDIMCKAPAPTPTAPSQTQY